MKKLVLLAAGLLMPVVLQAAPPPQNTQAHAVRFGLGGTVDADGGVAYLPIELSPAFRVEPFFAWSESETTIGGTTTSTETRQLGGGGFFRMAVHERIQTYAGGRLYFMEIEGGGQSVDGFGVEPTVGAELWVTDRFSVALEAFLYRTDLDGSTAGGAAVEQESTGSDTRFLVRFFP